MLWNLTAMLLKVIRNKKISEVNKMENFELEREEIERLWSQIVSQMGITRFSHTEWQKAYEDFRKCMLPESKCLIQIQSVNNAEEIKTLYLLMIYVYFHSCSWKNWLNPLTCNRWGSIERGDSWRLWQGKRPSRTII